MPESWCISLPLHDFWLQAPDITFDVISMASATGWTFSIGGMKYPVQVDTNHPWYQDTSVPGVMLHETYGQSNEHQRWRLSADVCLKLQGAHGFNATSSRACMLLLHALSLAAALRHIC